MKLADEWKHAWKWLQTWLITVLSFSPLAYEELLKQKDYLPPRWFHVGLIILGGAAFLNMVRKKR